MELKKKKISYKQILQLLQEKNLLAGEPSSFERQDSFSGVVSGRTSEMNPETVFVSYNRNHDLANYQKAVQQGVVVFICESVDLHSPDHGQRPPHVIPVGDARKTWAYLEAWSYNNPQDQLCLTGVTGTNGKSSTVWYLYQLLQAQQIGVLAIGTLGIYFNGEKLPSTHTTPDPDHLYYYFALAVKQGLTHVVMEVSSHSLCQEKLAPVRFQATVFTSFSQDHLDFHPDMKAYAQAKLKLLRDLTTSASQSLMHSSVFDCMQQLDCPIVTDGKLLLYGEGNHHDIGFECLEESLEGSIVGFKTLGDTLVETSVPISSQFMLSNLTAAIGVCNQLLIPVTQKTLTQMPPIPGRLELIQLGHHLPKVLIDFAHTPDALEKLLIEVNRLKPATQSDIWLIFGCGGNRDTKKRPLMGAIAEKYADHVIITSDNPRQEDQTAIAKQIEAGMSRSSKTPIIENSRYQAIKRAIDAAKRSDYIIIAGKGHEQQQIFADRTVSFSDRDCSLAILKERNDQ